MKNLFNKISKWYNGICKIYRDIDNPSPIKYNDEDLEDMKYIVKRLEILLYEEKEKRKIADELLRNIAKLETVNLPIILSLDIAGYLHENGY